MRKEIRRWGESLVISFDKEEQKAYRIVEGKIFDVNLKAINMEEEDE